VTCLLYPIFLEIKGRPAVVVGGGKVAVRKTAGLVESGANVTVVSPELTPELVTMAEDGKIQWRKKPFSADDLDDALLVIAATNERETNLQVKKAAGPHQLVTIADNPAASDFQVPSVVRRGKLNLAVSTSGASPTLAKKIREELEEKYDERYIDYLEFLDESRMKILTQIEDSVQKRQLLKMLAEDENLLDNVHRQEMAKRLEELLNEET
jgi:precorrin-2 dehydrogenase / sirohydrochlorin ferrochelatase